MHRTRLSATATAVAVVAIGLSSPGAQAASQPLPEGTSYAVNFVKSDYGTTAYGYRFLRRGSQVRYVYYPSAGSFGCFKGRLKAGRLTGTFLAVGNGYIDRSTKPRRVWHSGPYVKISGVGVFRFTKPGRLAKTTRRGIAKLNRECLRLLP